MSDYAEQHRKAAKARAHRLAEGKVEGKVDASDYGPPSQELFNKQTSAMQPKRRAYKAGGKVEGEKAEAHAGKSPRRSKKADGGVPTQRFNFSGNAPGEMARAAGLKTGGRAKKADGGEMGLIPMLADGGKKLPSTGLIGAAAGLKRGGKAERPERASGGRTKGKTSINIVIAQPHSGQQPGAPQPDPTQAPPAPHPANMPVQPPPTPPPAAPGGAPPGMPNQFPTGGVSGGGMGSPGGAMPH